MADFSKRDVFNLLIERGSVFVHLNPCIRQTEVPPWLMHQDHLVLQYGLDLPIPIKNLRVDEMGISGELSFSRSPWRCYIPWAAVFALVSEEGRGKVWQEDVPGRVRREIDVEEIKDDLVRACEPSDLRRKYEIGTGREGFRSDVRELAPRLTLIPGGDKPRVRRKRAPVLRVVK